MNKPASQLYEIMIMIIYDYDYEINDAFPTRLSNAIMPRLDWMKLKVSASPSACQALSRMREKLGPRVLDKGMIFSTMICPRVSP